MTLNDSQLSAVQTDAAAMLVIASPGSGKTRTVVERIRHLISQGVDPLAIVAITFTNAAAEELQSRLVHHGGDHVGTYKIGYCGTLHGFMLRLIQRYGRVLMMGNKVNILTTEQRETVIEECISAMTYKGSRKSVEEIIKGGPIKLTGIPMRFPTGQMMNDLELVNVDFYSRMQREGLLDFDSILWFGHAVVQHFIPPMLPDVGHGARLCGETPTDYLFVDELQDSSELDMRIYDALPVPFKFFVGDPDQSVYAFRGGRPENVMELARRSGTTVVLIEENYRSDVDICQTAQQLIQRNRNRIIKVTRSMSTEPGEVCFWRNLPTPLHEQMVIAQDILKQPNPIECAVLVRNNRLVKEFSVYLESRGIPVRKRQAVQNPIDWPQCRGLIALLANPENDRLAHWWLCHAKGEQIAGDAKLKAMEQFVSINQAVLHIPLISPDALPTFLAQQGISLESVKLVQRAIGEHLVDNLNDLNFLMAEQDVYGHEIGHGVTVTTAHSSKGREWDTVYLPACEQNVFPIKNANIEEERRLFFVAMTRARHRLVISYADSRAMPRFAGDRMPAMPTQPSQFIAEIGGDNL